MADETPQTQSTVKDVDVKGYKFNVDTDLLDDVDSLEYIERIENQGQTAVVLSLLKHIMPNVVLVSILAHCGNFGNGAHTAFNSTNSSSDCNIGRCL